MSKSLIPRGDASNRQQPPYTRAAEGASPRAPEISTNTQESAESLLSHVEITDDYDLKDHNDGYHFLACEIDSRVAASTCMHLERKKHGSAASKVQLEAQHAQLTRPTHVHVQFFLVMATARQGLLKLLSSEAKLTRENVLEYARDNHMGKQTIVRVLENLTQNQTLDFSGLKKASVSDLCSLLHQHSRGSHNRRTDDDVTMDLDSDNLDEQQDECIDEGDSEMARGSSWGSHCRS